LVEAGGAVFEQGVGDSDLPQAAGAARIGAPQTMFQHSNTVLAELWASTRRIHSGAEHLNTVEAFWVYGGMFLRFLLVHSWYTEEVAGDALQIHKPED
jgi:hypothetical protein